MKRKEVWFCVFMSLGQRKLSHIGINICQQIIRQLDREDIYIYLGLR